MKENPSSAGRSTGLAEESLLRCWLHSGIHQSDPIRDTPIRSDTPIGTAIWDPLSFKNFARLFLGCIEADVSKKRIIVFFRHLQDLHTYTPI